MKVVARLRPLQYPRPALSFWLPLLLLALFLSAGCAKPVLPPSGPALRETPQSGATQADPAPAEKAPEDPAGREAAGQEARVGEAQKSSAAARDIALKNPARMMLESAGRDPDAPQPEQGFALLLPDRAGDGEAFCLDFAAFGVAGVDIEWRGKSLHLEGQTGSGPYRVLLPVKLDEKSASLPLAMTVHWQDGKKERFYADMPLTGRKYPVQRLSVDSKFVSPPPEMEEKIKRDRAEMRAAVTRFTPVRYWTLPMLRPVPGEVTSLYGSRRVFNKVPKNPHKGVDFDAKEGDPIRAMEDGVVVLVAGHYYGGNTVVVDHGLGVLSAYLHLSGFNAAMGQKVARGDVIGYIGSTGRVTGPHLHLSLYVLGESINAAPCIDM
ncbi:peptidoglycan DD-metalloendopeptidase family protein [Desulfovibrio sp. OttesenSCG-928-G11]|nr:peptidoglycan DD-metalloendopeptidase family protein [Desulfovibrio sp. OttesenSCG-928-G11]